MIPKSADQRTAVPAWFLAALATPVTHGRTELDGVTLSFRAWGEPSPNGVLLVHGGGGHAGWWDHIGPFLVEGHRVVAVDLSGHGDSGYRSQYSFDVWAQELNAVADVSGLQPNPVIVGHSLGGYVAMTAALRFGSRLGGVVLIDTAMQRSRPAQLAARDRRAQAQVRLFETREEMLERFRPIPDQGRTALPYVLEHIGYHSVRETDGAWTWKFDPKIFGRADFPFDLIRRPDCRVAFIKAEHGQLSRSTMDALSGRLGQETPMIEIPDVGHHVMLERPIALVTALRTLLSVWTGAPPELTFQAV